MADLNKVEQLLKGALEQKNKESLNKERAAMMQTIGADIVRNLRPVLAEIARSASAPVLNLENRIADAIRQGMKSMEMPKTVVNVPPAIVNVPDVYVPPIPAPVVNYTPPAIKIPEIKMPDEMKTRGELSLIGWGRDLLSNPIPVQLRDAKGNPVNLFENLTAIAGGGSGGGKMDFFTVKGITNTIGVVTINPDGSPTYSTSSSGSGSSNVALVNVDGLYYNSDNPLPVTFSAASIQPVSQVSGHIWSVSAQDALTTVTATSIVNADNRIRVSVETGGSGLTDSELRATAVPVEQVSGSNWSVTIAGALATVGVVTINPDGSPTYSASGGGGTEYTEEASHEGITVTGPVVMGVRSSTATSLVAGDEDFTPFIVDANGGLWVSLATRLDSTNDSVSAVQSGPWAVDALQVSGTSWSVSATQSGTWTVTGITNTVATANVDSTGVQYSGSNPMPTYLVASSGNSTISVGDLASDAADTGSSPVKIGGIARTANPTAVAAGDRVSATYDDLGRQVMRPIQVRDLIVTAYVSVTNGTETTLLAASAGSFHDCIMLTGSNNSDAAVSVDIRAVTAGNIIHTMRIPANATAGWAPAVPWPQDATGNNWTVDGPDETGRTLTFSGLFSREV